jgi:hypothetical protein
MDNLIYLYEKSEESQKLVVDVMLSIDSDITVQVENNTLCSSIDIILDEPAIIISAFNLKGLNGVESYDSFRRKHIPIIYYTSSPSLVYESLRAKFGHIPPDVYCIDKGSNPSHLKVLVRGILQY